MLTGLEAITPRLEISTNISALLRNAMTVFRRERVQFTSMMLLKFCLFHFPWSLWTNPQDFEWLLAPIWCLRFWTICRPPQQGDNSSPLSGDSIVTLILLMSACKNVHFKDQAGQAKV
jgi:hypothetical protein